MQGKMKDFLMIKSYLEKEMHHSSSSIESTSSEDTRGNSTLNSSTRSYIKRQIDDVDKQWGQAAIKCDIITMKELFSQEHNVLDKKDYFTGYAAIHWASKKGRNDILEWLNDNHADMNLRTGYTALHIAAMHEKMTTILRLIKDFDVNPDIRDYGGRKASHYISDDVTEDIKRALNIESSSLPTSKNGSMLSLTLSKSTQALNGSIISDGNKSDQEISKKKKRTLSITQSFKHRRRKMLLEKRNSDFNGDVSPSPSMNQRKFRSMSAQDDIAGAFERQLSIRKDSNYNTIDSTYRKKSFASENIINGYAGYLTNSKCRRQLPSDQSIDNMRGTQWGINTWV